ncbi:hypothetical protein F5X68DRAFT_267736 [Plectosphaerella plurivora]|uniref:Glycoprotease family protein n=1 Tax=Plectosphaerella plurivora TaxID=936078 RepID=A0A9P9ADT7_9PEZI|nr:hypothetical protein F5X68DRAFT_267736 [Plectosphaerella plurivora]
MNSTNNSTNRHGPSRPESVRSRDDWEDWEDDEVVTPIMDDEQHLIENIVFPAPPRASKRVSKRASRPRHSRQQTQNARAGIKHGFMRDALRAEAPGGKFALEGDPNSASKNPMALSPEDRPIVIGISIPPDVPHGNASTDARATMLPTPLDATAHPDRLPRENPFATHTYAVWSPDTPETTSTLVYSQAVTVSTSIARDAPPVPAVPETYQHQERLISLNFGYTATKDQQAYPAPDSRYPKDTVHPPASHDSPLSASTTFSADIAPSVFYGNDKAKADSRSPGSAETQTRGWWDHVVTPFTDKTSPLREALQKSQQQLFVTKESATRSPAVSATVTADATADVTADVKSQSASQLNEITPEAVSTKFVPGLPSSPRPSPRGMTTPIVKIPTPRRTPSPFMISRTPSPATPSRSGTPRIAHQNAKGMTLTPNLHDSPLPDQPPPYSPPDKQTEVKYRAVFPAGHPLHQLYPPSPRPVSPAMAGTMSSQALGGSVLPRRQPGAFVPQDHFHAAPGPENRVERERRRHEKEEVIARKMGGFWKGRGCMPKNGCFGRSGREGRKRRRVWFGLCCAALSIIILIIVLCVVLIPRTSSPVEIDSIFVNLTNFPPMPTGVLSVVGPDNRAAVTGCTRPSTVWSCSLPKEEHESVKPFKGNQPNFYMQVQWDNNTREPWNVPNGQPPKPGSPRPDRRWGDSTGGSIFARAKSMLDSRQDIRGFTPNPEPPSFQEMWFLGNSTDGVVSEDKGGEPTPFYISILKSAEDSVGPNVLNKRQEREDRNISDIFAGLPEPVLEDDGTAGPARFYPEAVHQPVRLYDRGLDSEHYAFYTYFDRSIYLKSVSVLGSGNNTDLTDVPLDEDGGSTRREASFVVTWSQTRFLVQMWTRRENSTRLLPGRNRTDDSNEPTGRPGTMPYPVTIKMDTHGGQPGEKLVWHWQVDTRQRIDTGDPKLMMNDISFGSPVVNPRARNDTSFGGFDGGTGGCRCEWTNFMERVRSEPSEI